MISLMKLTSLLLVETLSHSDYIMVYVSNKSYTDDVVLANPSQKQLIKMFITDKLDVMPVSINLKDICQEISR